MSLGTNTPEQGQLVDVRQRRYVVVNVTQNTLPLDIHKKNSFTQNLTSHHIVQLASVEDDALDEELQVIWEIEPGAQIVEKANLPDPTRGFDSPARLEAFLNAVRWGAISSADVRALQSPFRSGIEIEDYQLDPVARAIGMPRANLLIADDVGLGKTIEAGLVAQELIVRNRARKVMVICPAALQIQWHDQMRDKFGLEFKIVDNNLMKTLRRERGLHVNPWTHYPRLITSIDYLKQERMLRLFGEVLPAEGESTYPRRFDLLIIDEAHNVAPSGRGKYATDSQRTQAVRRIAPHFEHKLFLSATPHNGYPESFTALLELLDNQRFARGVRPDPVQLHSVMVRRLKSEFKDWAGKALFPKRILEPLEVNYTGEERQVSQWLHEYTRQRLEKANDEAERYATEFTLKLLKKRLLSSPEAFAVTLEQHLNSLANARKRSSNNSNENMMKGRPTPGLLRRQLEEQVEQETDDDDILEEAVTSAFEVAAPLFRPPSQAEQQLLNNMQKWADVARGRADKKALRLITWLNQHIRPGGKWGSDRVIIFTEYRTTQNWLVGQLAAHGFVAEDRLMTLYGGMSSDDREEIKAAFQADPATSPVRILLATDAASEGIDLQNYCSRLIHYEIPWNPTRMEQRNGRVDRHGQRAPQVTVFHFVSTTYKDFHGENLPVGELDADLEFLMRAVRKVEAIREDLGKVGPVIAEQVESAMLGQRHRLDTRSAEEQASPIRALLKLEQKIQKEVERLHDQLQESRRVLDLTPENVQAVVEVALELAGQQQLRPAKLTDPHDKRPPLSVFYLPPLRGSWASCTQGLEHPFTGEVRPIVFNHDDVNGRDDVVLAHLGHKLVAMSLRLLRAEVWAAETSQKLNRVTAKIVPDAVLDVPAVIVQARLLVTGGDSQRLHEELIAAGGFIRQGRFTRMNVGEVQRILESDTRPEAVGEEQLQNFQALWPELKAPLYRALEVRMQDRQNGLQKLLLERQTKEQRDIESILLELQQSIEAELGTLAQPRQLVMAGFNTSEREQFERNLSALQLRVTQIPGEIEQEKEAISRRFANPEPRLFPVAVTFFVPRKLAK